MTPPDALAGLPLWLILLGLAALIVAPFLWITFHSPKSEEETYAYKLGKAAEAWDDFKREIRKALRIER